MLPAACYNSVNSMFYWPRSIPSRCTKFIILHSGTMKDLKSYAKDSRLYSSYESGMRHYI